MNDDITKKVAEDEQATMQQIADLEDALAAKRRHIEEIQAFRAMLIAYLAPEPEFLGVPEPARAPTSPAVLGSDPELELYGDPRRNEQSSGVLARVYGGNSSDHAEGESA
jgi:hypothetical protein